MSQSAKLCEIGFTAKEKAAKDVQLTFNLLSLRTHGKSNCSAIKLFKNKNKRTFSGDNNKITFGYTEEIDGNWQTERLMRD